MSYNPIGKPVYIMKMAPKWIIDKLYKEGNIRFYTPQKWVDGEIKDGPGRGDRFEGNFAIDYDLKFEEVHEKLKELGLELSPGEDKYTEKNHPGRDKCDKLCEIRKKIADANGIDFEPAECHHTGPCLGTCPVCDEEIKYLDEQLKKKKARGEDVILNGLAINEIKEARCDVEPNDFDRFEEMGENVPYNIKDTDSDTEVNNSEGDIEMGMDTPDDSFDGAIG